MVSSSPLAAHHHPGTLPAPADLAVKSSADALGAARALLLHFGRSGQPAHATVPLGSLLPALRARSAGLAEAGGQLERLGPARVEELGPTATAMMHETYDAAYMLGELTLAVLDSGFAAGAAVDVGFPTPMTMLAVSTWAVMQSTAVPVLKALLESCLCALAMLADAASAKAADGGARCREPLPQEAVARATLDHAAAAAAAAPAHRRSAESCLCVG